MYIEETFNTDKNLAKGLNEEEKEVSFMKPRKEEIKYNNNLQEETKAKEYDTTDSLLDLKTVNNLIKTECPKLDETFELLEPIKAGSSGAVHKARIKRCNNRIVALKILNEAIKDKRGNKKAKPSKEFLIHMGLFHKNIPKILGYYPLGKNNTCMAMEYSKYGDIDNFKKKMIKRQKLSETLINYIAGGIAEALLYLSTKKIIHMDIKQQNVLIDDFLNIRLTDYSVSSKYDINQEKIELKKVGTCYYMSPEVLEKKTIDLCDASKIDVFSFGVLLYFLAFHEYPYNLKNVDSTDYSGMLKNIKEEELVFPQETGHSKLFKNFVAKCLEKDIKKRYSIYQIMNDPWMKGYQIIQNEKEYLVNAEKFMVELMVDRIKNFNDYIKEKENELE